MKNPKWGWGLAIVLAFVLCGAVASAQQQAKVAKIGFLTTGSGSGPGGGVEFLPRELRAFGYVHPREY
jgi:hypothetical protein